MSVMRTYRIEVKTIHVVKCRFLDASNGSVILGGQSFNAHLSKSSRYFLRYHGSSYIASHILGCPSRPTYLTSLPLWSNLVKVADFHGLMLKKSTTHFLIFTPECNYRPKNLFYK